MRKRRDTLLNARGTHQRRVWAGMALASLTICAALLSRFLWFQGGLAAPAAPATPHSTPTPGNPYLYLVLKQPNGFVLARTSMGANDQPIGSPQVITGFDDAFGQSTADTVVSIQTSPDGRYLAIDGTRSDGELLWIFDTSTMTLSREPAHVSGTFLRWMTGPGDLFLYRPILPLGPGTPADWQPGLWIVDPTTGTSINIDIHIPSTFIVDAIASPNGSQIIYSTSSGLGMGSDVWSIDKDGQDLTHLFRLADNAQSIAGMFSWSPNGLSIAYERLADSPTPFLPAGLWIMDRNGSHQRLLAQADGGHGFTPRWSPDSTKIAFVTRTNPAASMADQSVQALQSAIDVVNVSNGHVWSVANPLVTGVQINANPTWNAASSRITFAAFNPLNPEIGGSVRYWSAQVNPTAIHPSAVPLTPPITHVAAVG